MAPMIDCREHRVGDEAPYKDRVGTTAFCLRRPPQAAENEGKVITLSCDGTLTRTYGANKPADPEPLQKTGAVVNLDEQTVFFLGYVVPIESVDEASIDFGARQIVDYGFIIGITGHIDRASGRMDVTTVTLDPTKPNDPNIAALHYEVVCATNSVF
jgi:hypothetical protein